MFSCWFIVKKKIPTEILQVPGIRWEQNWCKTRNARTRYHQKIEIQCASWRLWKPAVPEGCRCVSHRSSVEKEVVSWRWNHQHQSRFADGRRWLQVCKVFVNMSSLGKTHALSVRGNGTSTQFPSDAGFWFPGGEEARMSTLHVQVTLKYQRPQGLSLAWPFVLNDQPISYVSLLSSTEVRR